MCGEVRASSHFAGDAECLRVTGMYASPPSCRSLPQYSLGRPGGDVALPADGALDEGAYVEVGRQRDPALEVGHPADVAEPVLSPPHCVAGAADQRAERAFLDGEGIAPGHLHLAKAAAGEPGEGAVEPPEEAHETAAVSGAMVSRNSSTARANASRLLEHGRVPAFGHRAGWSPMGYLRGSGSPRPEG
jgi:hypothetical protein